MRRVGHYEILEEVGRGGMAIVHKARDVRSGEVLALKQLAGAGTLDGTARERFVRSARVAGGLEHPNVVSVREVFEWEGTPYLAMELVEWGSLRPWLAELTPAQFAGVFDDALAGLAYIAGQGLVHRDIKPENLLVSASGRVKLSDFVLAKSLVATGATRALTPVGEMLGTPSYMAPEQATAQGIGPWSDLYALGCIAYEALVGHVPFHDPESPYAMLLRRINEDVPAPVVLAPRTVREVSDWVARLLARDPADRPESAEVARRELEAMIIGLDGPRWRGAAALPPPRATPRHVSAPAAGSECPNCGAVNPADGDFCERCGAYLRWEPAGTPPAAPVAESGAAPAQAAPEPMPDYEPPRSPPIPAPRAGRARGAAGRRGRWWRRRAADAPPEPEPEYEPLPPPAPAAPADWAELPPPREQVVRRTPHLDVAVPLAPALGSEFEVAVYADQEAARPGEEVEEIVLRAPADVVAVNLDVWLVATHHFLIADAPIRRIGLVLDEPCSDRATFRVAFVAAPSDGEEPLITASFSCNGRPSGRVTRSVPIGATADVRRGPEPAAAPVLEVDLATIAPDLTIEIAAPENDGRRFEVRVDTPLLELDRRTESWFLPVEATELVSDAMERFFDPDATPRARMSSLRGAGLEFFDAAPQLFKDVYWRLADQGRRPRHLFVVSDERSIPWELMIPSRRGPGGPVEHEPLGVQMAVGRWHRQTGVSPRQRAPLASSIVVAPHYAASARLEHAAAEAEYVCRHFAGNCIEPASFDNLDVELGRGGADLLHFVCHGEADDHDQVLLLEEPDKLHARQIRAMPGLAQACRDHKPLVFLNACELGRQGPGLSAASSFAKSFIDVDATGVIGTLWSVDDKTAHEVAIEFYEHVLRRPETPFAEILRRIRMRGYEESGQDSWAAYCFYGDPAARAG